MHESRKDADYDLRKAETETRTFALLCVKRADRVRDQLKYCRQREIKSLLASEMDVYRKTANISE